MTRRRQIIAGLLALGVQGCLAADPWTLERALSFARTNSPDARIAQERVAEARAIVNSADSAFWPKLQFQSSYVRTDNPMLVFGSILNQQAYPDGGLNFNDVPDADNLNLKGVVSAPLYAGGRISASRKAARSEMEAARHDAQAVLNALEFEVSRMFYTAWKTKAFTQAVEAAVRSYETNAVVAERRFAAGNLLKVDLLDIQVKLAQAREDVVRARNAHILTLRGLRTLLGLDDQEFTVADATPSPLRTPSASALPGRPELDAAAHMELAAEEQVKAARSGFFPRLSAFASLDHDYGFKFDHSGNSYTAGGLLQWDIWDGKLTRAKVDEASARLATTREQRHKLQLTIALELERARLDLNAASDALLVSQQAVEAAAQSADLNRARFQAGEALSAQWLDAETALVSARMRVAQAQADRSIAIASVRKALGLPQLDSQ